MLSKRSKPLIGKLTGTGIRLVDGATSPRSPLEMKSTTPSPRGLKSYDLGGVGLGIVAALEKSDNIGCEFYANKPLYNRNLNRSRPIPVNSAKLSIKSVRGREEMEMDSLEEEYTFVTCRGPDNKSYTRVYRDGGEQQGCRRKVDKTAIFDSSRSEKSKNSGIVFDIPPPRFGDFSAYPTSDFLSSCHLCQKKLHGKDIYMYRGEKAFCSPECRYRQIVMDERKEKCRSEAASRSVDLSTSPYTSDQIFSTGILAI